MHFGMFMQFETRAGASQAGAFSEGFELIDAAESMGLDGAWLAEMHFTPDRSVLSSPITIASSIATRTRRLRIGMAVYVLPLNNPLRIAEEVATVDQISEALDIILQAWEGEPFSYQGQYYQVNNATVAPLPYQKPHPPFRMAATTAETFPRAGEAGYPIFVGLRGMDIPELRENLKHYRKAWSDAGHAGDGDVSLRVPVYVGQNEAAAIDEPFESIQAYFGRAWVNSIGRIRVQPVSSKPNCATTPRRSPGAIVVRRHPGNQGGVRHSGWSGRPLHEIAGRAWAGRRSRRAQCRRSHSA